MILVLDGCCCGSGFLGLSGPRTPGTARKHATVGQVWEFFVLVWGFKASRGPVRSVGSVLETGAGPSGPDWSDWAESR